MKAFEIQVRVDPERLPQIADELATRSGQPRHRILAELRSGESLVLSLPDDPESMRVLQQEGVVMRPLDATDDGGAAWAAVLGEAPERPKHQAPVEAIASAGKPAGDEPALRAAALWSEADASVQTAPSDVGAGALQAAPAASGGMGSRTSLGAPGADEEGLGRAIRSLAPPQESAGGSANPGGVRRGRRPNAWLALLLGLLAPGLGQVYLGAITGGLVVLVCSFLILPWPLAAGLAAREAARQRRGRAIPEAPTRWGVVVSWALAFWLAVFAFVWLVNTPTPLPSRVGEHILAPSPRSLEVVPRSTSPSEPGPPAREPELPSREPPADVPQDPEPPAAEADTEVPRILLEGLVEEATEACDARDWDHCLRLADRALSLDPASRDAMRLRLDAMVGMQEAMDESGPSAP